MFESKHKADRMDTTNMQVGKKHGYQKKQDVPYFFFLHSSLLVPSIGVEGILLALWESLVAFPVL